MSLPLNPSMIRLSSSCAHRLSPAAMRRFAAAALTLLAMLPGADAAEPAAAVAAPARIEERKPEIYYLEDDSGRLVPVPGFRYRDFVELLRLREGLPGPAQPPGAVLEEIRVRADLTAAADGACPVTVTCTIRQSRRGWVDVPLGCAGLVLARAPGYEGPGRLLVDAAPDRRGYRAWLDASPEAGREPRHVVTLEGRLPVDVGGDRESLVVRLPTATASAVEIRSGRRDPEVVTQPAAAEQKVQEQDGGSLVTLSGIAGTTTIRVGPRAAGDNRRSTVAEAAAESVVRIDGRDAITQARITLGGLPDATATVRIALPPAATLRSVRAPATLVARGGTAEEPFVDVAVVRAADGGAVVELECQRPLNRAANAPEAGPFELAGFAVEGIEPWRQWGRISLVVEGEWQAVWGEGPRRVDPPAAGRRPGLVAAFAYDAQPASLKVRVTPRPSRVVIEPEYRYDVSAERVALQARLRVAASGAPATDIGLEIEPAWVIDEIGPPGVVDAAGVTNEGGRVRIPFAEPLVGDAVIEIRGSRPLKREDDKLHWLLPNPLTTGLVGPASVAVGSASDIELLPDNARIRGLVRQTSASLSQAETDAVVLAYRLDVRPGEFAATRRYLPRRVDANVTAQVQMDDASAIVTETIRLDVAHVPLEFIELLVPEAVAVEGGLEVRQDAGLLDPVEVPVDDATAAGVRRLRAILPGQLLGAGELVVRYSLPTPAVPLETTLTHDLPLVLPVADRITRQTLLLESPERLAVEVRGDAWRRDASQQPVAAARSWSTTRPQDSVPLALSARRRVSAGGLAVDAALLRTSVAGGRREDIFTYALSGAAERLRLTLPGGPAEIRIDGQPVAAAPEPDGGVEIELPRGGQGRWLLEISRVAPLDGPWDRIAARFGLPVRVPLDPPRFSDDVVERRFAWEIDSRPDEWLVGMPASWTGQQRWRWQGFLPDREPVVSRGELATWVRTAAAAERKMPPAAVAEPVGRRAVYAGVGGPGAAQAWLLPTWFLVLVCSGTTLAAGMACQRVAALRRQGVLVAAAGALVVAAAAVPDVAALAALAAVPGVVLAGLAWLLGRLTGGAAVGGRGVGVPPTESSLTRAVPAPSLVINGAAAGDSVTATGRVAP
jgi:hypothetical protein